MFKERLINNTAPTLDMHRLLKNTTFLNTPIFSKLIGLRMIKTH